MNVGIVIGRIGGVDGVALEAEKWASVLSRMGHRPRILAGELEQGRDDLEVDILPALAFSHADCVWAQEEVFYRQAADETTVVDRLHSEAKRIEEGLREWLSRERIDVLVTQNATSLPCHLTMGMALRAVIEATGIETISHNHDFAWERGDRYDTQYAGVRDIIESCFPPVLPSVRHVVINTYARDVLRDRYGIEATVVPNVMDFDAGFGRADEFSRRLPRSLGLPEDAKLLFQVTRIVRRKGIESAIELVRRLDDPSVRLIITGTTTDDRNDEYGIEMERLSESLGVRDQVLFVGDRFASVRSPGSNGDAVFSLSDGYAAATACTYFSTYEGFGNAFVEAVAARRPIFVNNYKPVYWPDIGSKGFKTVQIENGAVTDEAVALIAELLDDTEKRAATAEFNHVLGREHFSLETLERHLSVLLS